MRQLLRLALVMTAAATLLIGPFAPAQGTPSEQPLTFTYRDDDGQGRLTVQDVGADSATGGRLIKVSITQNGARYDGSGVTYQLEPNMPFTTLITFTVVSVTGRSYFFQGKTTSGITLSGQGTYHRVGFPEARFNWNIVLGG